MTDLVGHVLSDRYRVDAFLGRGGVAEVYKVWDNERATFLALKLLRDEIAHDIVSLRRFRREAKTLFKLQHPNIVRYYGLEQEGLHTFMLMDYVDGQALEGEIASLRGKAMPRNRVRRVMRAVCSALHFAHAEGLVHSDIKPSNIMIDHHDQVYLTDFGLARVTDAATYTKRISGTPAYMSPEQVREEMPSHQTDFYGLGIVLFEMLTGGERPFNGERSLQPGVIGVLWEHVNVPPYSPRSYNPEISPELEAVVMRCLEKDAQERYADALNLLEAFQEAWGRNGAPEAIPFSEDATMVSPAPLSPEGFGESTPLTGEETAIAPPAFSAQPSEDDERTELAAEQGEGAPRRGRRWAVGVISAALLLILAAAIVLRSGLLNPREDQLNVQAQVEATVQAQAAFEAWLSGARVLLYEDIAGHPDAQRVIYPALTDMGLQFTDAADSLDNFEAQLGAGDAWDLIIAAVEMRHGLTSEVYQLLDDVVAGGSGVIIETWYLDPAAVGGMQRILDRCGLEVQGDFTGSSQPSRLDVNHPVFQQPHPDVSLGEYTRFWEGEDLGELLRLGAGSASELLLVTGAGTSGDGMLASCMDGLVLLQTFRTHAFSEFNMRQLWENYIYHVLLASFQWDG